MPRPMSSGMLTALQASILYPAIFVNMGFASGTVHIWSGVGSVTWGGNTYTGVGSFGGISVIEEGSAVEAKGIALTLSGIDATMLADALQEMQLGLPISIYMALYASRGGSLIADPLVAWAGRMDQPEIVISGTTATISIKAESRIIDLNVPVDRRLTLEDSQIKVPGDLGFQFVFGIQEKQLLFGTSATVTQNV